MVKPKIAILATSLVPPHPAGTQILEVVDALSSEFDFTVYAREIDKRLVGKVSFVKMPIPLCKPLLLRYLVQYFLYWRLLQSRKLMNKFDIVHAIEATSPYATVVTMHFCGDAAQELIDNGSLKYKGWRSLYYPILNFIGTKMERRLLNNAFLEEVIVVSKGLKKNILSHYKHICENKIKVIYNYADLDRFISSAKYRIDVRKLLGLGEDELVGVIVALGDWQRKGLDLLIEAFTINRKLNIKILVVGGGPIAHYKKICDEKGVAENFVFLGFQKELEKFYGASDFFIFPSAFEAFPLVLLEAAASGLPILASKIGGTEEIVKEGVNGLFIIRSGYDIAEKLSFIYNNRYILENLSKNTRGSIDSHSKGKMVNKYRELYNAQSANLPVKQN